MSSRTEAELAEAVKRTVEAAEHARAFPQYDLAKFRPVRGDHLAVALDALRQQQQMLRRQQDMLEAICTHLGLDPREVPADL
ncbi:hypothetical protein AB0J38_14500 [Streptomyces sp. NPDC050095]|uniref:hypothetical protein n=1 Tax=unclassified Streptomyces TaxID=2593676 RepID=UPI00343B2FCA